MDKYYRGKVQVKNDSDLDFQIIEWWCQDEELEESEELEEGSEGSEGESLDKKEYAIRCFGVTSSGESISCKITGFKPYYYVKVPEELDTEESPFNRIKLHNFLKYVESSYSLKKFDKPLIKNERPGDKNGCGVVEKKDLFGFRNGKTYKFIKLVFNSYTALMRSRYIFKNVLCIKELSRLQLKYKLYESNFEPFMRYCHIKDIRMAGWIRLPGKKYKITRDTCSTQIEVSIDRNAVVSLKERQEIARFLQASWDIETYSCDNTFPDPKKKILENGETIYPNVIYQIATTYKYYTDKEITVKHLLTLKKCAKINEPNVIVEECKTEKELIKKFVDTISKMDPDVMYTYNGDSFDCMYLVERAVICGLLRANKVGNKTVKEGYILSKLSRMLNRQADIKKEFFSSSAYGDSEFNRVYIPGRLNYDLLIHYKRGMKKYASYKLDYIANEILQEGKHDVSAKEIFGHYRSGDPELIRKIGVYCIQDTELLQKLVDKQLVLITIIQLANVTFVPIGFLTTRGQTIKVYSQILRKARQMDFLVPHTNFNEDSYPIQVKTKEPHLLGNESIGDYIEINCGKSQTANGLRDFYLNGKISEIIDDTNLMILCNVEIQKEYFNVKMKYKSGGNGGSTSEFAVSRLFPNDDPIEDSFTGATVLTATNGMHTDNVAILDFASLYPTIEISRNLCFSTLVMDPKYLNIPGVKYETIEWNDTIDYKIRQTCQAIGKSGKSKGKICGNQAYFEENSEFYCRIHDPCKKTRSSEEKFQKKDVSYSFTIVQPSKDSEGNEINKGVVPALLEELYQERKNVKKLMNKAYEDDNKLLSDILNHTQLAIKVSLNSCYGFLSRNQGNLICKPLGQLTTAVGRMLIQQSKDYSEQTFVNFVRENELLKQKIIYKEINLSKKEKKEILDKFKVK